MWSPQCLACKHFFIGIIPFVHVWLKTNLRIFVKCKTVLSQLFYDIRIALSNNLGDYALLDAAQLLIKICQMPWSRWKARFGLKLDKSIPSSRKIEQTLLQTLCKHATRAELMRDNLRWRHGLWTYLNEGDWYFVVSQLKCCEHYWFEMDCSQGLIAGSLWEELSL